MAPNMFTNTEEGDTAPTSGIRPRQPDKYYGQRDFLLLGNWIFSVDQYFILTDMPIHKQGPFISTLLRDKPCYGTMPTMKIGTQQFHLHGQLFDMQCVSILHLQMKIVVFKMSGQI